MSPLFDEDKPAARSLAKLCATPPGLRVLRLLASAGDTERSDGDEQFQAIASAPLPDLRTHSGVRIGVWESKEASEAPVFVRRRDLDTAEFWADVDEIGPRNGGRKRVVLVGESVARGYFHDPYFNPAKALRAMLSGALGDEVEVIDLARTDIVMLPLLKLIKSSVLLKPDAIVLFAGNNWHPQWAFRTRGLPQIGVRLRETREWCSIRNLAEASLVRHVHAFAATLGTISASAGVPVVVVIPELNLVDWRDECPAPPLLGATDTSRWLGVRALAEDALARQDSVEAKRLGLLLIDLDRDTTPIGHVVMGDACRIEGNTADARKHLRASRDVSLAWPRSFAPGIPQIARRILLDCASQCGYRVVDLQRHFDIDYANQLPDRRLFHDYCHLTLEGTRTAMAHAAEEIVPLLGGERPEFGRLLSTETDVPRDALAAGDVLAAVVNANMGQSMDVVRHHLSQAVRCSPAAASMIEYFADFHTRRTAALVCQSVEQLLSTVRLASFSMLFGFGRRNDEKTLHLPLLKECVRVVAAAGHPESAAGLDQLLLAEHSSTRREVDLLDLAYGPHRSNLRYVYRGRVGYFRAFQPASSFALICDRPYPVRLSITFRSGQSSAQGEILVAVNGTAVGSATVAAVWRSATFVVPDALMVRGVNHIVITWPAPAWVHEEWIDATADLFEANVPAEIVPVFGHIHAFRAAAVPIGLPDREELAVSVRQPA